MEKVPIMAERYLSRQGAEAPADPGTDPEAASTLVFTVLLSSIWNDSGYFGRATLEPASDYDPRGGVLRDGTRPVTSSGDHGGAAAAERFTHQSVADPAVHDCGLGHTAPHRLQARSHLRDHS